jgi:uncharacterized protein (UPF0335 family)
MTLAEHITQLEAQLADCQRLAEDLKKVRGRIAKLERESHPNGLDVITILDCHQDQIKSLISRVARLEAALHAEPPNNFTVDKVGGVIEREAFGPLPHVKQHIEAPAQPSKVSLPAGPFRNGPGPDETSDSKSPHLRGTAETVSRGNPTLV